MATADLATVRDALTGLVPFAGVLGRSAEMTARWTLRPNG
jgi:hypothetical protein